ncbi:MAG: putative Ig domain-containing protein [Acidobacteriia bacterium]|nr:putative Ig domain-containing protein [Terriglobia bacterium]
MMVRRRFRKLSQLLLLAAAAIPLGAQTPAISSLASTPVFGIAPVSCLLPAGITVGATLNQVNAAGFTLCINGTFTPTLFQSVTWAPAIGTPTVFTVQNTEALQTAASQIALIIPATLWNSVANVGNVTITVAEFLPAANQPRTSTAQFRVNAPLTGSAPTLPNATVGDFYSQNLFSGGTAPFVNALLGGGLPPGLTIPAGATALGGVPAQAGGFSFRFSVTDAWSTSLAQTDTIVVNPAPPPPLAINTPSALPGGVAGVAYSLSFNVTGGTPGYSFAIVSGALPPGLTLSAGGTLSGTPTTAGQFAFGLRVTDSAGVLATRDFSLAVTPAALSIATTSPLTTGQVGVTYAVQFSATGGTPPYSWTATGVPAGLALSAAGLLSGAPTASGTFTIAVTATDNVRASVARNFSLTVNPSALAITTAALPNGTAGAPYAASVSAAGGVPPYKFTAAGLPPLLTIDSGGTLSGTPSVAGTSTVTVVVTDSRGVQATKSYTVIVAPLLTVSTTSLPAGVVGNSYSATLAANGGTPPYTWSAASLPAGLKLASDGTLSGTPTAAGTASIAATVTDSNGVKATQTVPLTIALPAAPAVTVKPVANPSAPTQQTLQVTTGAAYPLDITVTFNLTFAGNAGRDDPTVLFANNSRTTQVVIPAGSTSAPNVNVQTGTVAGTITIASALQAGGQSITPSPAAQTITIAAAAPVIAATPAVTATRTSTGFSVVLNGFATSLEVTQAQFTFTAASGANLQTGQVTVPVTTLFSQWYQSSASAPFGSQFAFTQPFTVQGSNSAIVSVTVTLVNSVGSSAAVTVNLQ